MTSAINKQIAVNVSDCEDFDFKSNDENITLLQRVYRYFFRESESLEAV